VCIISCTRKFVATVNPMSQVRYHTQKDVDQCASFCVCEEFLQEQILCYQFYNKKTVDKCVISCLRRLITRVDPLLQLELTNDKHKHVCVSHKRTYDSHVY